MKKKNKDIKYDGWGIENDSVLEKTYRAYKRLKDVKYASGKAEITPTKGLRVGCSYNFKVVFIAGPGGIKRGGAIKFAFPRTWSRPQQKLFHWPGFVQVKVESGSQLGISFSLSKNLEWYITITFEKDDLREGERLFLRYRNVRVQNFPQQKWLNWRNHLAIFVGQEGKGDFLPLRKEERYYRLIIKANEARKAYITIPSRTAPGEPFNLKVSILDEYNNPSYPVWQGRLFLYLAGNGRRKIVGKLEMGKVDHNSMILKNVQFPKEGIYRVRAISGGGSIQELSNPSECRREWSQGIYFGDIHAHTSVSDGLGTPDEYYDHSRHIAHTDFSAIVDHNHRECGSVERPWQEKMSPKQWLQIKEATRKWNDPGSFVTLLGMEEPMAVGAFGHRNIYYLSDDAPLFKGVGLKELNKFLKGKDALVIPHHTLELCRWVDHNPELTSLIEIYSMWGSSEERESSLWTKDDRRGLSVGEILNKGVCLGFIAGSDNHHGAPALSAAPSRFANLHYPGGIAAVYAPKLTREEIFKALKERRCYATSGERIIVEFYVNGAMMGTKIKADSNRHLEAKIIGTDRLRSVEVIKNGCIWAIHEAHGDAETLFWEDKKKEREVDYYYLRVIQADGARAWSSPIYVR